MWFHGRPSLGFHGGESALQIGHAAIDAAANQMIAPRGSVEKPGNLVEESFWCFLGFQIVMIWTGQLREVRAGKVFIDSALNALAKY